MRILILLRNWNAWLRSQAFDMGNLKLNSFGGLYMEDAKKKTIMIAIIILGFVVAGAISYKNYVRNKPTSFKSFAGQLTWVKCSNKNCNAEYQMDLKDYYTALKENPDPNYPSSIPALVCEKCRQKSVYLAEKCEKCGLVFYLYSSGAKDFKDRCPKCRFSKIEEEEKLDEAAAKSE